ncbi:RNA polymerase sigma factor SigY [Paenibacillus soyae]|uniref:RNA polymerase sigma factor n=1 Tax=Paenibacillus soyae TaxID=2969249 RepID=A0A9X2MN36_9BACL|nr:RNA polymerase sigma factor SigY [Paenibacillus soyae]MCR2803335.1 RNA polymerase sigma factor SigY [Paenibacillus soyae]
MHDEAAIIKQAVKGDIRSLSELLRLHYSFLYQYVLKLTMDKSKAEDITQETMLKAIEKIGTYKAKAKFSTWLIAIASRLVIDRARRSQRERRYVQEEGALRQLRYESLGRMNDWPDALEALGQLDENHRMAVLLKYYYGYAQEEIADMLDTPLGTVKSRIHAGIKQLRKEMAQDEEERSS